MRWIIIVLSLLCFYAGAQDGRFIRSDYYENHIPKIPEASALGSFGNTPINYFKGLPEISLELMRLKGRNLDLPVSLNYDAHGVRTDDISGPAGMKWTLSAGGFVARQMNGLPDEHPEGYFRYAYETDNFLGITNITDWVGWSEKNERDTHPDEFFVNIPGRTIKFVFDKFKRAVTLPRQNVRISYGTVNNKISSFEVITEDGVKYIFGDVTAAIEERKIENATFGAKIGFSFAKAVCGTWNDQVFGDQTNYSRDVSASIKTIDFYNSKWYLTTIRTPDGESMSFTYEKRGNVTFAARPGVLRIRPMVAPFTWEPVGFPLECGGAYKYVANDVVHYVSGPLRAVIKYPPTDPGSPPPLTSRCDWDWAHGCEYLVPEKFGASPGGANVYHSLITESVISLTKIESVTGNQITIKSSSRTDLPNAIKYDLITLYNENTMVVKSVRLNFATIDANEENDYFWLSEALMMDRVSEDKLGTLADYYANHTKNYRPEHITDADFRKYVFEGLKPYNYKRLFLESIDDVTAGGSREIRQFEFSYHDRDKLKRRTTVLHDVYGFQRTKGSRPETWIFKGRRAKMLNAYERDVPWENAARVSGTLSKIKYPTNGYTSLTYVPTHYGFCLHRIQDYDEQGRVVNEKEMEYEGRWSAWMINESYQDFVIESTSDRMKYHLWSTGPQNGSYAVAQGVERGSTLVILYHGTKANNNGFECFRYHSPDESKADPIIHSIPAESNKDGRPLQRIFPFPKFNEVDYLAGKLRKYEVYTKGSSPPTYNATIKSIPVREVSYHYVENPDGYLPPVIYGFKGGSFKRSTKTKSHFWYGHTVEDETRHRFAHYAYSSGWVVLDRVKEIMRDDADPAKSLVKITSFKYDADHLQQIESETALEGPSNESIITRTKYVTHSDYRFTPSRVSSADAFTDGILRLQLNHQVNSPVEVQTLANVNGALKITSSTVYKYQRLGSTNAVKAKEVWTGNLIMAPSAYSKSHIDANGVFVHDARLRKVHSFDQYDPGTTNLLQQTSLDGTISTYSWAHKGSVVSDFVVNPGNNQHKYQYTFKPSVGVTSITDANSLARYYDYDVFGRLKYTRDHDKNILNRYRYHYASVGEDITASINVQAGGIIDVNTILSVPVQATDYGTTSYSWTFGDGNSFTTQSDHVYHIYRNPGTYTITVTKSNPEYGTASASRILRVGLPVVVSIDGCTSLQLCNGAPAGSSSGCSFVATGTGGCSRLVYTWYYRMTGQPVWTYLETGPVTTFLPAITGEYELMCVGMDECNNIVGSNIHHVSVYPAPGCGAFGD